MLAAESPSPISLFGKTGEGLVAAFSLPLGRALKNYRYFHFIGVFRRHYRAFTRRSGYDVW